MNIKLLVAIRQSSLRTQVQLSARTCIPETRVSRIINGRALPTSDERRLIAEAVGKPESELFQPRQQATSEAQRERAPADSSSGKRWLLAIAIEESPYRSQARLCRKADIREDRLSRIISGSSNPTNDERQTIASLLGRQGDVDVLFAKGRPWVDRRSPDGAAA